MSGRLAGKVALITGAASGIGADCARMFVREGAQVVLTDVQTDKGRAVAAEVGGEFLSHDVSDEAQWVAVIEQVLERHGRLDVVINNAGIFIGQTIEDTEAKRQKMMDDMKQKIEDANKKF